MNQYPPMTRFFSHSFRIGLIALSMASAALLLTDHVNNISAKQNVQTQKQQAIQQQADEQVRRLKATLEAEQATFTANQTHQREAKETQLAELNTLITQEMDNTVHGEFKGKRYLELQDRQTKLNEELAQLQERQNQDLRHYSEERSQSLQRTTDSLNQEADRKKKAVPLLLDDPDSDNKMVRSFLLAVESSFSSRYVPTTSQFIFTFAMLLSALIELGIMVAFENVVVALAPLMRIQLAHGLKQEMLKTNLQGEQVIQDIQHEAELNSIRRKVGQTVEKAKTYVDEGIFKA